MPRGAKDALWCSHREVLGATAAKGPWLFCGRHAQHAQEQRFGIFEAVCIVLSWSPSACIAALRP